MVQHFPEGETAEGSELLAAELLRRAAEAASAKDPVGMMAALHASRFLDGLVRRLQQRFRQLPEVDLEECVAEAADSLYKDVSEGVVIRQITSYLYKVAERRSLNLITRRPAVRSVRDNDGGQARDDDHAQDVERAAYREEALGIARRLLPQIGRENVQKVMRVILDALNDGLHDITNAEIAEATGLSQDTVRTCRHRGFVRLQRLAAESGLSADIDSLRHDTKDDTENQED